MLDSKPKVSVVMITYNHEKFIEQAVNSALMQETDFDYEIIIGEDCSTDRTREILIELQKQHPDKIKLVLNPQNLGMIPNFVNVLSMARGEYIALLEGDDYWTSPHKLQRQVDYMDAHPECRICFHATEVIFEDEPERPHLVRIPPSNLSSSISFESWLRYRARFATFMATSSVLYRSLADPLPQWYSDLRRAGDWPLFAWLLFNGGKIGFLEDPKPMSVYRKHSGGVSHVTPNSPETIRSLLDDLHDHITISQHLGSQIQSWLRPRFFNIHKALVNNYLALKKFEEARYHLINSFSYISITSKRDLTSVLVLLIRCYFPRLYPRLASFRSRLRQVGAWLYAPIDQSEEVQ